MRLPDLPELELTDTGLVYAGRQGDFRSIEGLPFKGFPLLHKRPAQAFWGFDTSYPLGSSSSTPRLGLHFANGEIMWLSNGWDFAIQSARLEAIRDAAEFLSERTF